MKIECNLKALKSEGIKITAKFSVGLERELKGDNVLKYNTKTEGGSYSRSSNQMKSKVAFCLHKQQISGRDPRFTPQNPIFIVLFAP